MAPRILLSLHYAMRSDDWASSQCLGKETLMTSNIGYSVHDKDQRFLQLLNIRI
jgi:hypothetical protein